MGIKTVQVQAGGGFDKVVVTVTEPRAPGAGEISVRVRASSLNFHDYLVVSGPMAPKETRIPLSDGAGEVLAVGSGVTEFAVGDQVVSTFFQDWEDGRPREQGFGTTPGDGIDGFAREQVTMPAAGFTRAPRGYSPAEAATLTTAGLTAWRALFDDGPLMPGETVLVQGSGGVSVFALQFAKLAGARVIATSSSDEKLERLRALGADALINYRRTPEWAKVVREQTGGCGADHVIEVGGPATLVQSMRAARVGGHIALIGVLTGGVGELPLGLALARQLRLQGVLVGSRAQQQDMIRAIEAADLRPVISDHFPLEALVEAFRHQEAGRHFGKIVLDI